MGIWPHVRTDQSTLATSRASLRWRSGTSARDIAAQLNAWRIPTVRGGRWGHQHVLTVLRASP